jgi:hypothetical protein
MNSAIRELNPFATASRLDPKSIMLCRRRSGCDSFEASFDSAKVGQAGKGN